MQVPHPRIDSLPLRQRPCMFRCSGSRAINCSARSNVHVAVLTWWLLVNAHMTLFSAVQRGKAEASWGLGRSGDSLGSVRNAGGAAARLWRQCIAAGAPALERKLSSAEDAYSAEYKHDGCDRPSPQGGWRTKSVCVFGVCTIKWLDAVLSMVSCRLGKSTPSLGYIAAC